jgi:hypothetical protein
VNGKSGILRLFAIASILGLSGFGLAAAPAGAVTAPAGAVTAPAGAVTAPAGAAGQHPSAPFSPRTGKAERIDATHVYNFNSLLCLGIKGGNGTSAVQWNCINHGDQLWRTGKQIRDGYYQIINNDNRCLGVQGGSTREGAAVVGRKCLGTSHPDQYWQIESGSCYGISGYFMLKNYKSHYVVGVLGNSGRVGAAVVQWRDQGVCNNQVWFT